MTIRRLPKINAFEAPTRIEWDVPIQARDAYHPVQAATDNGRSIAIDGEITSETVAMVRDRLAALGAGDVTVNINSPGGDFFAGLAAYNLLREHAGTVATNVLGIAASAASVIAMASDVLRVAKAGFLMIHNSWAVAIGNRHDMQATADMLGQFDVSMSGVYADRSGIDRKTIAGYMDAESLFGGEQAVKLGLADELLPADQIVPAEEPAAKAAYRRLDLELARQGMPRSERRALLTEIKGDTPRAVLPATPCAGDLDVLAMLREITSIVNA